MHDFLFNVKILRTKNKSASILSKLIQNIAIQERENYSHLNSESVP